MTNEGVARLLELAEVRSARIRDEDLVAYLRDGEAMVWVAARRWAEDPAFRERVWGIHREFLRAGLRSAIVPLEDQRDFVSKRDSKHWPTRLSAADERRRRQWQTAKQ